MRQITTVVIGGWVDDNGEHRMVECLGVFEKPEAAYGEALLYLDEIAGNCHPEKECTLTTLLPLEGDTGYALLLKDQEGKPLHYAYVLDVTGEKDKDGGEADAKS